MTKKGTPAPRREVYRRRTQEQIKEDNAKGSKVCWSCETRKPFSEFFSVAKSIDGVAHKCRDCTAAFLKTRKKQLQDISRRYNYGLEPEDYEELLKQQQGCCAICKADNPQRKGMDSLVVDHCHKSEEVRGLLCDKCNKGIGLFNDDHELLIKAARYLYFRD